jgi:hypothetical protein
MFLFLSLGFAKRSAELYNRTIAGAASNSRRPYEAGDLPQINTTELPPTWRRAWG